MLRNTHADESASADLLRRARNGDNRALSRLLARYWPRLHSWAHGRVPAWARRTIDTADMVQEAILHTIHNLKTFAPNSDSALMHYLRRALINRVHDQVRYAVRHPSSDELTDTVADKGMDPLESAVGQEDYCRYRAALGRLSKVDRRAIIARIELGYSYDQLALTLRKPTSGAARLAVRRAILRLADEMCRV